MHQSGIFNITVPVAVLASQQKLAICAQQRGRWPARRSSRTSRSPPMPFRCRGVPMRGFPRNDSTHDRAATGQFLIGKNTCGKRWGKIGKNTRSRPCRVQALRLIRRPAISHSRKHKMGKIMTRPCHVGKEVGQTRTRPCQVEVTRLIRRPKIMTSPGICWKNVGQARTRPASAISQTAMPLQASRSRTSPGNVRGSIR